jgi:hypothetical protein
MGYSLLADLTVLVHLLFVLFVVFGGIAVLRRPWLAWVHLPAAIWGATVELMGWVCPLTPLEGHFRRLGGESGYGGGFIQHYLEPLLYPLGLTAERQVLLGLGVVGITAVVYARFWQQRRHRRGVSRGKGA